MSFTYTTAIRKIRKLTKRSKVIQGGTSAGKTYGIIPVLIDRAIKSPHTEVSIVSHTVPHLKKGARKDFLKIMKETGRYIDDHWNRTDSKYLFSNESYIEFFSADQADKVVGPRRDILYINECNAIDFETYHQLAIRTNNEIFLDYNPSSHFWVHDEVIPEEDSDFLILNYPDNEALPQTLVKEIEKAQVKGFHDHNGNLNDENNIKNSYWANWWKVYGLGQVGSLQGCVFSNWKQGAFDESLPYIWGQDYGFSNDPDTLIKVAINEKTKTIYAKEFMYTKGQSTGVLVDAMKAIITNMNDLIVCDSANSRTIEDLQLSGFNAIGARKGPDSIRNGIKKIQDYELIVEGPNLSKELENYIWNDKKSETPVDDWNHLIDPLRYTIDELTNKQELFFG